MFTSVAVSPLSRPRVQHHSLPAVPPRERLGAHARCREGLHRLVQPGGRGGGIARGVCTWTWTSLHCLSTCLTCLTSLQYHPYLQFDRFLSNCFVGNLIHEGPQSRKVSSPAYLYIPGLQPHLPKLSPSPPPVTTTAEKIAENNSGNRWCVRKNSYHEPVLEEVEDSTSCTPSTDTPDSGIIQAGEWSPSVTCHTLLQVSCPRSVWRTRLVAILVIT